MGPKTVSGSVSSWSNQQKTRSGREEQRNPEGGGEGGGSMDVEDAGSVRKEAGGAAGLVSDAQTYADVIRAESRTACKHIWGGGV